MTQLLNQEIEHDLRHRAQLPHEQFDGFAVRVLLAEIDRLRAERDGLRNGLKREIAGAFVGGEVVYVSGLKLLLGGP